MPGDIASSTAAQHPILHQQTFLEKDLLPGSDRRWDSKQGPAQSSPYEALWPESVYLCPRGSWPSHVMQVQECRPNTAHDGLPECGELQYTASMAACESHNGHERDPPDQSA